MGTFHTYDTLNHDIQLEYKGEGKYDRKVVAGDWVFQSGVDALYTAICLKLITIFNELYNNPHYYEWGNKAHYLIKENNNEVNRIAIKDYSRDAIEEMRRVDYVKSIEVWADETEPYTVHVAFIVLSINDDTIEGGIDFALGL